MKPEQDIARLGFIWQGEIVDQQGNVIYTGEPDENIIPQSGIDHLVALLRGTGTLISAWYVGLGEEDFVPTSATTSAVLQSSVGECQAYSEATRPVWDESYDGSSIITNLASRSEFTFTAEKRVYTGFLVSTSTKGSATGTLLSIARFSTPYDIPSGSTFRLGVSITLLPEV